MHSRNHTKCDIANVCDAVKERRWYFKSLLERVWPREVQGVPQGSDILRSEALVGIS